MELGNKNPFIVLEDADIDKAAPQTAFNTCANSGMVCASPGRFYLHEKIHDEFVSKYIAAIKTIRVGDPNDENTDMGPVVSTEHRDRVEGYITSGIKEGAVLQLGGERPTDPPLNKGFYIMPTVLTSVKSHIKIFREEIFGPMLTFTKFETEEEAIRRANATKCGLVGYIATNDLKRAHRVAAKIEAGFIVVNHPSGPPSAVPTGGYRQSGFGRIGGIEGIREFTHTKSVRIPFA